MGNKITVRRWVAQKNRPDHKGIWSKVAGIAVAYIGATRAEAIRSCIQAGCGMLPVRLGGSGASNQTCYAYSGTPNMGAGSMDRSQVRHGFDPAKRYSLRSALDQTPRAIGPRRKPPRYVRDGFIGDPSALSLESHADLRSTVKAEGLIGVLSYTHGWRGVSLQLFALASCESLAEVDQAVALGYRASVVVPWQALPLPGRKPKRITTPQGVNVPICPAMLSHESALPVVCNDCGWCDPQSPGPQAVAFPNHDPKGRAERRKLQILRMVKATA